MILFILAGSPFWPFDAEVLPGDPLIIVNKKTNELAWVDQGEIRLRTKVATGKTNDLTPEGIFTVKVKAVNPYYRKKNIPGGDQRNPLGSRWIGFDAEGTDGRIYGLHGTNQPHSIGSYVSEGCIRLPKMSLESLYAQVEAGTKILITHSDKSFEQLASEAGVR
ncbi:L,D-transpeptidase [Siminovitchia fortis]|uniref:L,D-transpeptidase n=1 Tax=Siminovitchia fortis TaxID=254758 RepID=UPI001FD48493|nr:L,D-transpeptidase [Siminovitchia fortis]